MAKVFRPEIVRDEDSQLVDGLAVDSVAFFDTLEGSSKSPEEDIIGTDHDHRRDVVRAMRLARDAQQYRESTPRRDPAA